MLNTFYVHLELRDKTTKWSVNLPFLCTKCGACCTLEDFLTAGEINTKLEEYPEVHNRIKDLFEELGKILETGEEKYDKHIANTVCPFLVNSNCSIYEIRPIGCQHFPNTVFGMQTQDCTALNRFKKQLATLKRGKACTETFLFTGSTRNHEAIKTSNITEKQKLCCIGRLRKTGITDDELNLFNFFNQKNKK